LAVTGSSAGLAPGAQAQPAAPPPSDEAALWHALRGSGAILLMRHANAPGVGDPPGMRLGDCSTQRNLDEAGRTQARNWGLTLRRQGLRVGAVWSSQWCRAMETATLMQLGKVEPKPEFNSFFDDRSRAREAIEKARQALLTSNTSGLLVVVTHQVVITGLTEVFPSSAEAVVLLRRSNGLAVAGRLAAPT
jgi:broad specificity phosphatase PhoE